MELFRLETFLASWEFKARYVLCASDMETMSLDELLGYANPSSFEAWMTLRLGYTEPRGDPQLRQAIAATYASMSPENIACVTGAQEGIFIAMHALLGADDHAITIYPNYQSLETLPLNICMVTGVGLREERAWNLDIDEVSAAIRPETKLIVINFPHNPTGKIIEKESFIALIELARRHGIYLINDEVFRLLEYNRTRRLPAVADAYERGISIGVLSKTYGLPGLRIGWLACRDRSLLQKMEGIRHYLSICAAGPSEILARIALEAGNLILEKKRHLLLRNFDLLCTFLTQHDSHFSWVPPDGGCIGYIRCNAAEDAGEFSREVLDTTGVLLMPSAIFSSRLGSTSRKHFRIGFGRADFAEAIQVLAEYMDNRYRE